MPFFSKIKKKMSGLWYPQLITVGKPADTQEIAKRISRECTVTPADAHAVIRALPQVMADIMAEGRSVHLDGFGSFHYTCYSTGNGVSDEKKVSAAQIKGVRVQFTPYREREGQVYTRSLVSSLSFIEWKGKEKTGGGVEDPTA